ncbi:MAG TPA: tetratricopeptide repeat protein, partial [Thermodesulfobacteriota bacterium]|nr:tetratricopeptide repeat protein [Thermodesulfobacteriota bacterium]
QGQARLEEGNWQQTVQFLGQFEKMPDGPIRDRALVNLAIAYGKLGQKAKADAVYKELYKKPSGLTPGVSPVNVNSSSGKEENK